MGIRRDDVIMLTAVSMLAGLALLIVGAEALVRGASRLAARLGMAPLIIGLTVVAFGTSAPELAVSVDAARSDMAGVALGNVVGSNIFNVLFILGLSALITPLLVSRQLIRLDVPLMIGVSVLVWLLAMDGRLGLGDGLLLVAGLILYTGFLFYQGRRESRREEVPVSTGSWPVNLVLIALGLAALVLGARWLVTGAVSIATALGVSELVIGLTIIAAGTSLPEVVTSLVASLRGERDIAVGNVVGSNLFNLMGVLGIATLAAPGGMPVSPAVIGFDLPVMIAVAFACLPIFFTGGVISRWEGGTLFGYYLAYTLFLILAATTHDALPLFSAAMLWFVLPITALTLLVLSWQSHRRHRLPG
ncbi:MAG: calcium/sodium antiporter [Chromatiales bacterium]|nr:calcium/sodium antiporter [Chromatiales bacterium]